MISEIMNCIIDNTPTELWDEHLVLGKYRVKYYRCPCCGTITTEKPYWLEESYSSAIANSDIGLVSRNIDNSNRVSAVLKRFFKTDGIYLDYAAGYGMFVRMMRDNGFNFEWYDKYCDNLFSRTFEKSRDWYDAITAFEVMEHIDDPVSFLEYVFGMTDSFIYSTILLPAHTPKVSEWWYYAPEEGQHISFYTKTSMIELAEKFEKKYVNLGSLHVLTSKNIDEGLFRDCVKNYQSINNSIKLESLLAKDYKKITGKSL